MNISDNVKTVLEKAALAAEKAGKEPEDISVVAATKMNDTARVREAIRAGIRICGENRVQELVTKNTEGAYEGSALHFIGHLQQNKVKNVVGVCDLIESIGSEDLLRAVEKRASLLGIRQNILLEVNIGREENKSGISEEQLDEITALAGSLEHVHLCGLMAIPPAGLEIAETMHYFDRMRKLFIDIEAKKYDNVNMCILSMGMSHDYAEAIACGATMVRVGTAIFGARAYPQSPSAFKNI